MKSKSVTTVSKKQVFVVESCDGEEGQVFVDMVVANSMEDAKKIALNARRGYAEFVQSMTIEDHIKGLEQTLANAKHMAAHPDEVETGWNKDRLEYLRDALRSQNISYGELHEKRPRGSRTEGTKI